MLRETARIAPGELGPARGPFDDPPTEPIELDPEAVPWELRSDDER